VEIGAGWAVLKVIDSRAGEDGKDFSTQQRDEKD